MCGVDKDANSSRRGAGAPDRLRVPWSRRTRRGTGPLLDFVDNDTITQVLPMTRGNAEPTRNPPVVGTSRRDSEYQPASRASRGSALTVDVVRRRAPRSLGSRNETHHAAGPRAGRAAAGSDFRRRGASSSICPRVEHSAPPRTCRVAVCEAEGGVQEAIRALSSRFDARHRGGCG